MGYRAALASVALVCRMAGGGSGPFRRGDPQWDAHERGGHRARRDDPRPTARGGGTVE